MTNGAMAFSSGQDAAGTTTLQAQIDQLRVDLNSVVGNLQGLADFGDAIVHTSYASNSLPAETTRNLGTGGHQRWKHSMTGLDVASVEDNGLHATALSVSGSASVGSLVVGGSATVDSLTVAHGASIGGALAVALTSSFTGAAIFASSATVNGDVVARGNVLLGDASGDNITLTGSTAVNANMTLGAGVSLQGIGTTSRTLIAIDNADNLNIGVAGVDITLLCDTFTARAGGADQIQVSSVGIGFNGQSPIAKPHLGAAAGATYTAAEQSLLNALRTGLIQLGLCTN